MTKYLVRFRKNWADEFDVDGIAIYTAEELERLKMLLSRPDFSWYFGTNEGFEAGDINFSKDFHISLITDEEIAVLGKFMPSLLSRYTPSFGNIIAASSLEFYDDEEEEEDD